MTNLFVHMPKCAGTSVKNLLKKSGVRMMLDYDSYFKIPIDQREKKIIDDKSAPLHIDDQTLIFGHFFPCKYVPRLTNAKLVTILRDPLQRLKSHYIFWKCNDFPDHYLWRKMKENNWGFEDFALCSEMRNIYSQYFVNVPIERFDYIGNCANMLDSLKACASVLKIDHLLQMDLGSENLSRSSDIKITPDLIGRIEVYHSADFEIYNSALDRFPAK